MSAVYFVRQLGKVRGPFAPDHMGRLVDAGLIGPSAEVSTDRAAWRTLAAHLNGCKGIGVGEPTAFATGEALQPADDDFELDLSALMTPVPAEPGNGSEWFDNVDLGATGDV